MYRNTIRISTTMAGYHVLCAKYETYVSELLKQNPKIYIHPSLDEMKNPDFKDVTEDQSSIVFGWDGISWNPDFQPTVNALNEIMYDFEKSDIPLDFLRIGENPDDEEYWYSYDFNNPDLPANKRCKRHLGITREPYIWVDIEDEFGRAED